MTTFGPYRLLSLIGRGGMGEVWRAVDTRHNDRVVALKRLPAELAADPTYRVRFQREAAIAASLGDPHVIPIHDYGEIDDHLYIDMRLIEAADLARMLREHGAAPPDVAVEIVGQVAEALDEAHGRGLLHRDVKPSNMLVAGRVDRPFTYLIDFGIARTTEDHGLTGTGATIGTLAYMAPESFEGRPDHRADVYALACVLHEVLTGRQAMAGTSAPSYMRAHLIGPIPRPSQVRPGLPPALDAVIATGLAKDPRQRYPSAGDLAHAARAALAAPAMATPPPAPPGPSAFAFAPTLLGAPAPPPSPPRRRPGWLIPAAASAAAIVVALVVGLIVALPGTPGPGGAVTPTPPASPTAAATTTTTTSAPGPAKPAAATVGLTGPHAALFDKLTETGGVNWASCAALPEAQDAKTPTVIFCDAREPTLERSVIFYTLASRSVYDNDRETFTGSAQPARNCAAPGFGGSPGIEWKSASGALLGFLSCYTDSSGPQSRHVLWASPTTLVEGFLSGTDAAAMYRWWTAHAETVPS